jgi:glycosyltransferase 2 family protein
LMGSPRFACGFFAMGARLAPGKIGGKLEEMRGAWGEMHAAFWGHRLRLVVVALTSTGIWFLHLLQIWMFTIALRTDVPLLSALALAPLALLAGLLPLTFAGIGTRDAALVLLFAPYMAAADAAALGVLCTLRYFLPALGGLPFIGGRVAALGKLRQKNVDRFSLATTRPENSLPGSP